ncbi:KpsF/GutQ family sugar-phosphate isomerase [Solemya velum gill symbiont]|uniref:Arabinose 5-phosphate isomerase n=1 Tax=Solemya velum gill symbiont TaxID=2340 RepID=A0A0B0HBN5_SOVGS|nr:KpsF/GutQ family sugar-phosphate isomerase [Solemya velum gill symbiont]KHF26077.1 KpsF [Solemya velum gill symbiont]OOY34699.1 KpsF/GutQ family sugar isomerase [Solemya velum gill symbiont]OOY37494.1 KpsF/GutQ family sugar isomerase [Solemya velum gill symbiont]OOY40199.1 KpsF/GutQ family sugar isomerase [Solemya velum gill symbiont]OOY45740.1 KpsF/GutQ family sugar isomerase [Solemya velum gill symbiont]
MRLSEEELINLGRQTVRNQAQAVSQLEMQIGDAFAEAVACITNASGHTILCGMGKSGHIASKIAATFASTGTPSFFVHPAEAFHGDLGMITRDDVIILISYSGETDEVNKLLPSLNEFGIKTIAIVGEAESTLGRHAGITLTMKVDREVCPNNLAPTNSTLTTLALGDALAVALMEERQFEPGDFARFHPGGSLGRRLLTRVRDVMHINKLPLVKPGTPVPETIAVMNEGRLGVAIIVEDGDIRGLITDGDLRRALIEGADSLQKNCDEIMTSTPITIDADERFADAESIMLDRKINSLLVTDRDGKLAGVLQIYDL